MYATFYCFVLTAWKQINCWTVKMIENCLDIYVHVLVCMYNIDTRFVNYLYDSDALIGKDNLWKLVYKINR